MKMIHTSNLKMPISTHLEGLYPIQGSHLKNAVAQILLNDFYHELSYFLFCFCFLLLNWRIQNLHIPFFMKMAGTLAKGPFISFLPPQTRFPFFPPHFTQTNSLNASRERTSLPLTITMCIGYASSRPPSCSYLRGLFMLPVSRGIEPATWTCLERNHSLLLHSTASMYQEEQGRPQSLPEEAKSTLSSDTLCPAPLGSLSALICPTGAFPAVCRGQGMSPPHPQEPVLIPST